MGAYIAGMMMPKCCNNCDFNVICNYANGGVNRPKGCPLVEVKAPHGRLIDADVLETEVYTMTEWNGDVHRVVYEATVDKAPTVLEAEGKDDG